MSSITSTVVPLYENKIIKCDFLKGDKDKIKKELENLGITDPLLEEYNTSITKLIEEAQEKKEELEKSYIKGKKKYIHRVNKFQKEEGKDEETYQNDFHGMPKSKYLYLETEIILNSKGKILSIMLNSGNKGISTEYH